MKLDSLNLTNYRGFDQLEIKFQHDVNVIAGVNGVGKSSILHIIAATFARVLNEISPAKYRYFPIEDEDVLEGAFAVTFSAVFIYGSQSFQFGGRNLNSIEEKSCMKSTFKQSQIGKMPIKQSLMKTMPKQDQKRKLKPI